MDACTRCGGRWLTAGCRCRATYQDRDQSCSTALGRKSPNRAAPRANRRLARCRLFGWGGSRIPDQLLGGIARYLLAATRDSLLLGDRVRADRWRSQTTSKAPDRIQHCRCSPRPPDHRQRRRLQSEVSALERIDCEFCRWSIWIDYDLDRGRHLGTWVTNHRRVGRRDRKRRCPGFVGLQDRQSARQRLSPQPTSG